LFCGTFCAASQYSQEDRDGAAMLQTRRTHQKLQKGDETAEDCSDKDMWYWLKGHKDKPTIENGDFKKDANGEYVEWKVMDPEQFAMNAQVVTYARTNGKTCSQWCRAVHKLPCVRGMDDAHHQSTNLKGAKSTQCSVWPKGHSRKTVKNAGCEQTWATQMCACDEIESVLITPPEDLCATLIQQPGYAVPDLPYEVPEKFFEYQEIAGAYCLPDREDGFAEHVSLEMVGESITPYTSNNPDRNGRLGPFRQINIKSGTYTTFRFKMSAPGHRLDPSGFTFKMLDIDGGKTKARETFTLCGDHARHATVKHCGDDVKCMDETNGASCDALCSVGETHCKVFKAKTAGFGCDNVLVDSENAPGMTQLLAGIGKKAFSAHCPQWIASNQQQANNFKKASVEEMGDVKHEIQQARAVEILFEEANEFELTFGTDNGGGGRNFLYQLFAPQRLACTVDDSVPSLKPPGYDEPGAHCVQPTEEDPAQNEEAEIDGYEPYVPLPMGY